MPETVARFDGATDLYETYDVRANGKRYRVRLFETDGRPWSVQVIVGGFSLRAVHVFGRTGRPLVKAAAEIWKTRHPGAVHD